jgi:hypothetical protein
MNDILKCVLLRISLIVCLVYQTQTAHNLDNDIRSLMNIKGVHSIKLCISFPEVTINMTASLSLLNEKLRHDLHFQPMGPLRQLSLWLGYYNLFPLTL